ncbi:recombinase family protein [Bradyrhizobium diazoefficiens]|uniref:recombinase family protein n=1 Tax=Bradyrhizobium diazoefficiens TaxID=1355477 RepID=UPI001B8B1EFA|nr:recombinase family protein [Bradyrhizobium diazoefficiens]MBR0861698.1 recombinase family protein [Bradyrhizobium diazoefficiens]MBR0886183.1 recombinase family protein [Bradyrhizobium diazoefficiens]MBR0918006.1 recombinase family protein [Bradyrhizobium diazoefficiens]
MNKHVFRNSISKQTDAAKRVATYYRVSTGRQYANEASIPSQRKITASFADQNGYAIVEEFVEAKTATDDRRPVLQDMIERACAPDHPYDAILFYAFNRFFRNVAEMELTIRKLRKHSVEVVSVTQPTGDDPSQILVRQIIGAFDEHTSREISKNTTRAMRESAKQGFWNGATPPLGYRIVEAERRGQKIKKKLDIDAVEAETVRLMFKLYLEGDGKSGPLGVKETTKWLNSHGHRTRRGATFGVGPVHKILTNSCYATGQWPYGVRSSRDGSKHDPSTVIHIPIPVLIEQADFDRVQAKLARSNPKTTPPRVVNGPSLLTGIAVCASCGSGMTRTGTTNRQGRSYSYYSCAGCQQKGKSACKGRHVPAATLDEIVLTNLKQRVLAPDRIADLLKLLIERQAAKSESADGRLLALQKELSDCEDRLKRLYRSIEDGIVELDDILRERTAALKAQRDRAKAALDHARAQCGMAAAVTAEKIDAFARLMNAKLDGGDTNTRKVYIRSIIDAVEVDDRAIRIIGSKDILQAAIAGKQTENRNLLGLVRKWRARNDSNVRPSDS